MRYFDILRYNTIACVFQEMLPGFQALNLYTPGVASSLQVLILSGACIYYVHINIQYYKLCKHITYTRVQKFKHQLCMPLTTLATCMYTLLYARTYKHAHICGIVSMNIQNIFSHPHNKKVRAHLPFCQCGTPDLSQPCPLKFLGQLPTHPNSGVAREAEI